MSTYNELDGDDYFKKIVSGCPKNYVYRNYTGFECCKVRGFLLNYRNSKLTHFERVKEIVTTKQNW